MVSQHTRCPAVSRSISSCRFGKCTLPCIVAFTFHPIPCRASSSIRITEMTFGTFLRVLPSDMKEGCLEIAELNTGSDLTFTLPSYFSQPLAIHSSMSINFTSVIRQISLLHKFIDRCPFFDIVAFNKRRRRPFSPSLMYSLLHCPCISITEITVSSIFILYIYIPQAFSQSEVHFPPRILIIQVRLRPKQCRPAVEPPAEEKLPIFQRLTAAVWTAPVRNASPVKCTGFNAATFSLSSRDTRRGSAPCFDAFMCVTGTIGISPPPLRREGCGESFQKLRSRERRWNSASASAARSAGESLGENSC